MSDSTKSKPDNKWTQPVAPPPPMFVGEKERDLVKQINDEIIDVFDAFKIKKFLKEIY